jgi:hypothetical protein
MIFAAISVDTILPTQKSKISNVHYEDNVVDVQNPAKQKQTVSAQTYKNYKSALKWFHEYDCPAFNKEGVRWPDDVDSKVKTQLNSYKRDIGAKKRLGVMKSTEGKSKYSREGYEELCKYFNRLAPDGVWNGWHEGLFASLFTKMSTNTIGRSDNVDDMLCENMDYTNDSLRIKFGTTKPDQAGTSTAEVKRIFAN